MVDRYEKFVWLENLADVQWRCSWRFEFLKKRGSKGERERNLGLESSSWNLFLRGSKRWTKKDIHIRITPWTLLYSTQQLNYNPSKFFKGCTFEFFLSPFASGSDPLANFLFSSTFILNCLRQTLVRLYFLKKLHIF